MKKLLSKKAFTLVEVLVATAITGLLIAAVMALFGPVRGIIGGLEEDVVTNNITDVISKYMCESLKKANVYNIDIYNIDDDLISADPMDDNSVQWRYNKVKDMQDSTVVGSGATNCIMLKYDNIEGTYLIYDFGAIASADEVGEKLTAAITGDDTYAVFDPSYYNGKDFRFNFKTQMGSDPHNPECWCKIGVTVLNKDGTIAVEERVQMFRMLNMASTAIASDSVLEDYNNAEYSTDKIVVIFYNTKDYTVGV